MDVSIVITTYNYDRYLGECISSCLNQISSGLSYEIIVVDDGSTDSTQEILSCFYPPYLKSYRIQNSGIERASNFGFNASKGEYIVRVDADDSLLPNYMRTVEQYLSSGYAFFYSDYNVIDSVSETVREMNLPMFDMEEVLSRGDFLATGTLYHADLIKLRNGYNVGRVNSGLENYEFIVDLLLDGVKGFHISEPLFNYRRHGANISEQKKENIIENGKKMFISKNLGNFRTNSFHPYGLKVV